MNMDEIYELCNGDVDAFIDKAEECGFAPDEIWDYLSYGKDAFVFGDITDDTDL